MDVKITDEIVKEKLKEGDNNLGQPDPSEEEVKREAPLEF